MFNSSSSHPSTQTKPNYEEPLQLGANNHSTCRQISPLDQHQHFDKVLPSLQTESHEGQERCQQNVPDDDYK